ncbi:hypothetical protein GOBAR_DD23665 [Gossypium barbadense]|nr:hypothetical protein GOBAR_DD23665 [Gossypium barbadense]
MVLSGGYTYAEVDAHGLGDDQHPHRPQVRAWKTLRECPVARSPPMNLNHHESHNAADTCQTGRACHTAAGGSQTFQNHTYIRPLRSSDNIHRPTNPVGSHVIPQLILIIRALPVVEDKMSSDPDPSSRLLPIPQLAERTGGLSSIALQVNTASRDYGTILYTVEMATGR